MTQTNMLDQRRRLLNTPRAAAVAGILSGGLFITVQLLLRSILPDTPGADVKFSPNSIAQLSLATHLVPFAGIAFLWFLGVARDRLGRKEDQFFSTVFLGSGLLYLAITFTATGFGGGFLSTFVLTGSTPGEEVLLFARTTVLGFNNNFGVRMAAVFMLSSATMWQRTRVMPRWLALLTYLLGLGLLLFVNLSLWVTLIFPVWILMVSVLILISNYRRQIKAEVDETTIIDDANRSE